MANKILTGGIVTVAMVNAFSLYSAPGGKDVNREGRKPNFIIIMVDDMGYGDISTFGKITTELRILTR